MVDQNVVIKFKGESAGLGQASGEAVRSLDSVINVAQDAGQAISAFFNSTVSEFAEFERRINRTDQLFATTEGSARVTTAEINNFADALGDAALTSQEEVLRASNALQTFREISGDTFFRTLTAAQDLSEVLGSDLQGATIQLAKALEDPILGLTALRRSGVSFTEEQREMVKSLVETGDLLEAQNIILSQVEGQLGGAGVAAAQGFAGAVDTLGENLNDFNRTAGETAATVFTPLVNGAAEVLDTFNSLPVGIQKALFGITGFIGILGTATAAVVAFQVANKQLEIVQTAVLLKTNALKAATAAWAVVTGTADATQRALAASLATTALAAANVAAGFAAIALVANQFNAVTKAGRDVEASVENVEAALLALEEANARASGDPAQIAQTTEAIVEANKRQVEESLGAVTQFIDQVIIAINRANEVLNNTVGRVNPLVGLITDFEFSTAAEAAINRQAVQFGELSERVNQALSEYESFDAATATVEQFNTQLGLLESLTRELEANREIDPNLSDDALEDLREFVAEMNAYADANDRVVDTEEAIKRVREESAEAADAIAISLANQSELIRQSQLDGALTAEQAQEKITQIQIQGGQKRIEALQSELAEVQRLRQERGDEEELIDRERELTKELGDLQLGLVEQQIDAQEALAQAEKKRFEEAAKGLRESAAERERIIQNSLTEQTKAIRQQQLEGVITAEEAQEQITQLQIKAGRDRVDALRQELSEVQSLRNQDDSDSLRQRELELAQQIGQAELNVVEQTAQAREEALEREKRNRLEAIAEQSQAEQNLAREQIQFIEQAAQAQDRISRALESQNALVRARQGLLDSIADLRDHEFSIAAQLTDDAETKAQIEAEAAEARLESLEVSQAIERQLFELGVKRQQTELQIEAIRLRAAQAENEAEQARAQAAIEQARVEGASDAQIRSLQLGLNATRIEGQAIAQQREGLGQQATLLAFTAELERNTLLNNQSLEERQAIDEAFLKRVEAGEARIRSRLPDSADLNDSGETSEAERREFERREREVEEEVEAFRERQLRSAREGTFINTGQSRFFLEDPLNAARELDGVLDARLQSFQQQLARDIFPAQQIQQAIPSVVQPFQAQPQRQVSPPEKQATQFGDVTINQNNNVDVRGSSPGAVEQDFERVALDQFDQVATKLQELAEGQ